MRPSEILQFANNYFLWGLWDNFHCILDEGVNIDTAICGYDI